MVEVLHRLVSIFISILVFLAPQYLADWVVKVLPLTVPNEYKKMDRQN